MQLQGDPFEFLVWIVKKLFVILLTAHSRNIFENAATVFSSRVAAEPISETRIIWGVGEAQVFFPEFPKNVKDFIKNIHSLTFVRTPYSSYLGFLKMLKFFDAKVIF